MRKIIAGLFISLDGVVEAPDQWHFPYFNDEMGAAVGASLGAADTILFGRTTYDSFAGAWPKREAAGGEDAAGGQALAPVGHRVGAGGDLGDGEVGDRLVERGHLGQGRGGGHARVGRGGARCIAGDAVEVGVERTHRSGHSRDLP